MQAREALATKFRRKAFAVRTIAEVKDTSESGHDMKRVLGAFDLILLGIGCIIGAGIVVLTGVAANKYAGPGVVLSYVFATVAAMLTAFCYAEYASEVSVAGEAFNWVGLTFGEFGGWIAACHLFLRYSLAAAAIAKGLTAYTAQLIGVSLSKMRFKASIFTLDLPALLAVIAMSALLMWSTRKSTLLHSLVVGLQLLLIGFVICAGFPHVDRANYSPFLPYGIEGTFAGASVVFISCIGFDTVASAAEESKNPSRDLPIGIVGSLSISAVLYALMCLVLTGMQPYNQIDLHAPFSVAFKAVGLGWADRVVAVAALTGIVTALFGALLGQARVFVTMGRQHLLPAWLARVSARTGTPVNATFVTMISAGLLALFLDIEVLAGLVALGALVVFAMVCSGVLLRRYHIQGSHEPAHPIGLRLVALILTSIAFSTSFTQKAPIAVPFVFLGLWLVITASFLLLPVRYTPTVFKCPLFPWLPSLGVLCCLHLIGSLGWLAYVRWVVWLVLSTAVYLLYSMHHTQGEGKSRPVGDVELALPSGKEGANSAQDAGSATSTHSSMSNLSSCSEATASSSGTAIESSSGHLASITANTTTDCGNNDSMTAGSPHDCRTPAGIVPHSNPASCVEVPPAAEAVSGGGDGGGTATVYGPTHSQDGAGGGVHHVSTCADLRSSGEQEPGSTRAAGPATSLPDACSGEGTADQSESSSAAGCATTRAPSSPRSAGQQVEACR